MTVDEDRQVAVSEQEQQDKPASEQPVSEVLPRAVPIELANSWHAQRQRS